MKMRQFEDTNGRKHVVTNHANKTLKRPLFDVRPGALSRSSPPAQEGKLLSFISTLTNNFYRKPSIGSKCYGPNISLLDDTRASGSVPSLQSMGPFQPRS